MGRRVAGREHEPDGVVGGRFVDLDLLGRMLEITDIGGIERRAALGWSLAILATIARSSVGVG